MNAVAARFEDPLPDRAVVKRGLINETGFRVFARANSEGVGVNQLGPEAVDESCAEAAAFIGRFRAHSRETTHDLDPEDRAEARTLARRMEEFFSACGGEPVLWPKFLGCGWVDAAEGDVLIGDCLHEVKARGGGFRGQDVRQVLCYAAMARAAGQPLIERVSLVNPRLGLGFSAHLEWVCLEVGGAAANEVLQDLIAYMSDPVWETNA